MCTCCVCNIVASSFATVLTFISFGWTFLEHTYILCFCHVSCAGLTKDSFVSQVGLSAVPSFAFNVSKWYESETVQCFHWIMNNANSLLLTESRNSWCHFIHCPLYLEAICTRNA